MDWHNFNDPALQFTSDTITKLLHDKTQQKFKKSLHKNSSITKTIASMPSIVNIVKEFLQSDNICLWSSEIMSKQSSSTHGWHIDIEHFYTDAITVWIPLENVDNTIVKLISGSDKLNVLLQDHKVASNNAVLNLAKKYCDDCELKIIKPCLGNVLVWKGKVWHGTEDKIINGLVRHALLLQYCKSGTKMKVAKGPYDSNVKWHNFEVCYYDITTLEYI